MAASGQRVRRLVIIGVADKSWLLPGAWLPSMLLAGLQRGGRRQMRTKDLRTPVMKSRSPCRALIGDGILGDLGLGHTPGVPRLVREFYQEGLGHRVLILILGKVFVGSNLRAADCNETPEHALHARTTTSFCKVHLVLRSSHALLPSKMREIHGSCTTRLRGKSMTGTSRATQPG